MLLLYDNCLRRTIWTFAVRILVICCVLRLAPIGYGQSTQAGQQPESGIKPAPTSTAAVQPAAIFSPTGEATIYVYRLGGGWKGSPLAVGMPAPFRDWIFLNGSIHLMSPDSYIQAKVPPGKTTIAAAFSWGGGSAEMRLWTRGGDGDNRTIPRRGLWSLLPGCSGLDLLQIWISGYMSGPEEANIPICDTQLRKALSWISTTGAGPSDETIQLCHLTPVSSGVPLKSVNSVPTWTTVYSREQAISCQNEMNNALVFVTGTTPEPGRITIDAEAGKTYHIYFPERKGHYKIIQVDEAIWAKESHKLHPAKAE
jgi:hypothetical protein